MSKKRVVRIEVQRLGGLGGLGESCLLATSPDLPGLVVEADTIEVLILEMCSVAGEMLQMTEQDGLPLEVVYELHESGEEPNADRQPYVMAPASIFKVA